jgi:hypothetical protein
MSNILDQAEAHFKRKISGVERLVIEVAEWGTEESPCILYARPETMEEREKYFKNLMEQKQSGFVELILTRCRTNAGVLAFSKSDRNRLMNKVDPNVVTDIANKILEWDNEIRVSVNDVKND